MGARLYPPIVPSSIPAFKWDNSALIPFYYSISPYNSPSDIGYVQVSIKHQKTNLTIFSGYDVVTVNADSNSSNWGNGPSVMRNKRGAYKYYIDLNEVKKKANFELIGGEFYKVQLRFVHVDAGEGKASYSINTSQTNTTLELDTSAGIEKYIDFYSEWSTVCLIKPIVNANEDDIFVLNNLKEQKESEESNKLSTTLNTFIGSFTPFEGEILSQYRIQVLDIEDNDNVVFDSGFCSTQTNSFIHESTYVFKEANEYLVKCTLITINGYIVEKKYKFNIINSADDKNPYYLDLYLDNDNGRIKILIEYDENTKIDNEINYYPNKESVLPHIEKKKIIDKEEILLKETDIIDSVHQKIENDESKEGKLTNELIVIKRTDNRSNFTHWEELIRVKIQTLDYDNQAKVYYDNSVEHGIWYKYSISIVQSNNLCGKPNIKQSPIMPIFDSAFLVYGDRILKIPYTTTVSSFKRNGLESKTETLGSKYPYIRKNAYVDYKSFSLSSIISALSDTKHTFVQDKELGIYKYDLKDYQDYNNKFGIMKKYDYIYEKAFRDEVMDFLYSNTIKLFKTPTEGNILVKLMNINFTPQEQLGRLIYTMNAEAVEVASANITNYHKYDIVHTDTSIITEVDKEEKLILGQINIKLDSEQNKSVNIIDTIIYKHQDETEDPNLELKLNSFKNLTFTFSGQPNVISIVDGVYSIVKINKNDNINNIINNGKVVIGYLIEVDSIPIIVSPITKYYQIPEGTSPDSSITVYGNDIEISVDYLVEMKEQIKIAAFGYTTSNNIIIGQLYDLFDKEDSIVNILREKYQIDIYNNAYRRYERREYLSNINGVGIEAYPGTQVWITDAYTNETKSIIINETGYLRYSGADISIKEIQIDGFAIVDYICNISVKERIDTIEGE